jgi:hypothetical protein
VTAARESAPEPEALILDPWHAAVVDRVCAADAARVAAGEPRVVRLAVDHEFCLPTGCTSWGATLVEVAAIVPGLRSRRPIVVPEAAA